MKQKIRKSRKIWRPIKTKTVQLIRDIPIFASPAMEEEFEDQYPMEIEDSDNEKEDLEIRPSDNILIAGKIESEFASVEVYIFEEENQNLYVHHDFILSSFPVCMEWLGANFNQVENQ